MYGTMDAHGNPKPGWATHAAAAWHAFWITRLLIWGAGIGAIAIWGVSRRRHDFDVPGLTRPFGNLGDALVGPGARWDSYWFMSIARDGYDSVRAAFFPLYPLLISPAKLVGAPGLLLFGLVFSCACFVAALTVLHRLTELELGTGAARWTIYALALFPMSFFFSAVYSESLFLLLSLGAFYAARTDHWAWAGTLGALGAATRSAGILIALALVLIWLFQSEVRPRDGVWILLVPLGLVAYCWGLHLIGENWHAPFEAQQTWFRSFAGPFGGAWDGAVAAYHGLPELLSASNKGVIYDPGGFDVARSTARHDVELFGYLVVAVVALIGVVRRLPPAYAAYSLAALALPLSYPVDEQPLMSLPRFVAVLFPLFMWLGWWLDRGSDRRRLVVLGGFGLLLAISVARFATWHWVA
jgi:hypothetical protein